MLNDGGEVDLDLGNYERYLDVTLSHDNNITTGKIYREVIEREVYTSFEITCDVRFDATVEKRRLPREDCTDSPTCYECYSKLD